MPYHRYSLLLILLLIFLSAGGTAHAQRAPQSSGLDQAIRSVERSTGGQVLSADKRRIDGQVKYRIKVLTPSGRVRIIYVEAR